MRIGVKDMQQTYMKAINVKFGSETIPWSVSDDYTVAQLKQDRNLRVVLGYGDNVKALISSVEQPDSTPIPDGATVVVETASNSKAA